MKGFLFMLVHEGETLKISGPQAFLSKTHKSENLQTMVAMSDSQISSVSIVLPKSELPMNKLMSDMIFGNCLPLVLFFLEHRHEISAQFLFTMQPVIISIATWCYSFLPVGKT